jgi:hypothetical protein
MQSYQHLRSIWYLNSNPLSPIPEIPNSATISPELSPEPIALTSQSTKILSPSIKSKRPKRLEKRDLNIRIEKKQQKPKVPYKKTEIQCLVPELDSLDIYKKNKKEILKLIPETTKEKRNVHIYLSPERQETSRILFKTSSKRSSVPRLPEESKLFTEKLPKISSKKHEIKNSPVKKGKKTIFEALTNVKQKRDLATISKVFEETSHEVQNITKLMINKAFK